MERRAFGRLIAGAVASSAILPFGRSAARADDAKVARIAIQFGYAYIPVLVADKLGLFAKHAAVRGIGDTAFQITRVSGANTINDGLISGSFDVGAYGLPGLLIAADKTRGNFDIRGLAALVAGDNGLFVNRDDIKTLADFKPEDRIAVTGTTGQQGILLRMAAEKALGDARRLDTNMVQLPHPDATASLITSQTIAGYAAPHPYSDIVSRSPKVHKLFDFSTYLGSSVTSGLLATTGKFVARNPNIVGAIVAALREAGDAIKADPQRAAEIYGQSERSPLETTDLVAMLRGVEAEWGVQPKGLMSVARFMAGAKLIKSAPAKWQDVFFSPVADGEGS